MTGHGARGPSRKQWTLAAIFLLGLAIRAPSIALGWHAAGDIRTYIRWGHTIEARGLERAYEGTDISYPPILLYLFSGAVWAGGHIGQGGGEDRTATLLIQAAAALADLATAGILAWVVWRRSPSIGILAAGVYLFNPAVWYVSAVWGQTDSIYTLLLLACVIALERRAVVGAWALYVLALGTKVQAIALAPLVATWSLARYRAREVVGALAAAGGMAVVLLAPWLLTGRGYGVLSVYTTPPEARAVVSAYNFWYLALGGDLLISSEARPFGAPLTYQEAGNGLFAALAVLVVVLALRSREGLALPAAALTLSMFVVLTQMHERHAYPTLAFLAWGGAEQMARHRSGAEEGRRERKGYRSTWLIYGILTLTILFNMITILPFSDALGPSLVVEEAGSARWVILRGMSFVVAGVNIALLVWVIWEVWAAGKGEAAGGNKEARGG